MLKPRSKPSWLMAKLLIIAALAENGAIGLHNDLPWGRAMPKDMAHFTKITKQMGAVVMGRKTAESLKKPLPGRKNFVLSRQGYSLPKGFTWIKDVRELDNHLLASAWVAVIGGAEIYQLLAPHAHFALISRIHAPYEGDTFFPIAALNDYEPRQDKTVEYPPDDKNKHHLSIYNLVNRHRIPL